MSESGRVAMSDRQITITRGGEQYGPYPEANIKEMLAAGQVQPGDLAWHPGADGWKPLQELMGGESPAPPPVSYTHLRAHETRGNLVCRLLLEKKK